MTWPDGYYVQSSTVPARSCTPISVVPPWAGQQTDQYSNLEFDLTTGERGSRMDTAPALIAQVCGAEAAIVVNNCAAAVLLTLASLAEGKGVVVSRGELVEIGGGFRVPDVMARSGARLIEVGTTNRTRLDDFKHAVDQHGEDAALVLQVHQSNYKIVGFTEAPPNRGTRHAQPPAGRRYRLRTG